MERLLAKFDCNEDVICITITSKLSATYATALIAKDLHEEAKKPNRVYVVDSLSGCAGQGQLVKLACELKARGMCAVEIVKVLEAKKQDLVCFGYLETLDNAVKSGRISPLKAKIASTLNLKGIVHVTDGLVVPVDKGRGTNKTIDKVLKYVDENSGNPKGKEAIVCHANNIQVAKKIEQLLLDRGYAKVYLSVIGPVMGTHTAEKGIIVATI
ncbi:MAG: hypothetical protein ATN35_04265 [Epulopiscium sp. Nele67-Bin004]|nr:MAG: hypothetical protein ATN35_04265 [Epulopiscium sp. Nele67-Bin004]